MSTAGGVAPTLERPGPRDAARTAPAKPAAPAAARRPRDPWRLLARLSPLVMVLLGIGAVVAARAQGLLDSPEALRAAIESLGAAGPVVFVLLSALAVIAFPLVPGGLLVVMAPVLFGPVEGTAYSYLAVCAGSMANFHLARRYGVGLIARLVGPRALETVRDRLTGRSATGAFALAIALPVAPDDLLCYLVGTTRMRARTFALIILLGKPPALIAYGLGASTLLLHLLPW